MRRYWSPSRYRPCWPAGTVHCGSFVSSGTRRLWGNFLFPRRDPAYTYRAFLQAIAKFPAVCADYTDGRNADAICRKTLATMFAHFAQETGEHDIHSDIPEFRQALHWVLLPSPGTLL